MGLAKKLEGNPAHPVNRGKLCAWGQAGLQVTYNPDRIRFPARRTGARGSGEYQEISWEEAVKELAWHLPQSKPPGKTSPVAFLTRAAPRTSAGADRAFPGGVRGATGGQV